jgi:hypothetical protein
MYNNTVIPADEYLAEEQSIATTADGNGGSQEFSGTLGGIQIVAEVTSEITLTQVDSGEFTLALKHSDDDDTFTSLATLYNQAADGSADETIEEGTILERFVLPSDTKRYVQATITNNAGTVEGKVSIYPEYLAR